MRSVLILYQYFPIYREPLFRVLDGTPDVQYHFVLGDRSTRPGLPYGNQGALEYTTRVHNVWFGRKLPFGPYLWQRDAIRIAYTTPADAAILTGDWHIITNWIAAIVLRARRRHVFFHTMGWRSPGSRPENLVKRIFYSLADKLLLYGSRAKEYAISLGFSEDSLIVVGNSAMRAADLPASPGKRDVDRSELARLGLNPTSRTVICVSRLEPKRRADLLILAAKYLRKEGLDINLMLVGDCAPDYARDLKQMAAEAGVRLALLGSIFENSDLERLYALSDCAAIPGAAGLAVTQALGFGVPVVTGDDWSIQGPEVEGIDPGVSGYLYPFGSAEALGEAIRSAFSLADDPQIAEKCQHIVRTRYTAEAQAQIINEAVRHLAGHQRKS